MTPTNSSTGKPKRETREDRETARLCKALSHPARVRILRHLAARGSCVCGQVVEVIGLAQSTVSEHLRVLKAAGLVSGDVDGPRMCYCIDRKAVSRLQSLLDTLHA